MLVWNLTNSYCHFTSLQFLLFTNFEINTNVTLFLVHIRVGAGLGGVSSELAEEEEEDEPVSDGVPEEARYLLIDAVKCGEIETVQR